MRRALWGLPLWVVAIASATVVVLFGGALLGIWPTVRATPPLPEPLEAMEGDEFGRYVEQLSFRGYRGSNSEREACKPGGGPVCADTTTSVVIKSEKGSGKIGPGRMNPNGHIVAVLANTGGAVERRYQLPAATDSIYWLVEPGPSTTQGRSRFVRLLSNGGWEVVGQPHLYEKCVHRLKPPSWTTADFRECVSTGSFGLGFRSAAMQEITSAWVSCIEGCCVAR